ncbi:MAG TPA: sigma-70 region 4 domain-containing protein [Archangium sp.]|uniref:RNA polymerase sigma factor n=1 Tax=Archangium sp. TaxID=1872627 RepID=UPI002E348FC0|nr:sigma-70 region 4 domain-containing protein [Archangium sp.]HEX5749277.1 sigma-70 region 4 domain-containing protein [Archangium sp.]
MRAARPPSRRSRGALAGRGTRILVADVPLECPQLPANQRAVVTLRDVEGLEAEEVRELLQLSESNQRVLLHRSTTAPGAGSPGNAHSMNV